MSGSRCINGLTALVDAGEYVRVADRCRLHQIDAPPRHFLDIGLGTKENVQADGRVGSELQEKIRVAAVDIEVVAGDPPRAEDVQEDVPSLFQCQGGRDAR